MTAQGRRAEVAAAVAFVLACWWGMQMVHEGARRRGFRFGRARRCRRTAAVGDLEDGCRSESVPAVRGLGRPDRRRPGAAAGVVDLADLPDGRGRSGSLLCGFLLCGERSLYRGRRLERDRDGADLLRHGGSLWTLMVFGAVAVAVGLGLWNGQSRVLFGDEGALRRIALGVVLAAVAIPVAGWIVTSL